MADTGAPWNIPYAEPTDLVRDWPDLSEDVADAVAAGLSAAGNAGIGSNVQETRFSNTFTTTSTSFVDVTNFNVNITPTSNTSKVLVLAQITVSLNDAEAAASRVRLLRGSTVVDEFGAWSTDKSSSSYEGYGFAAMFLDSPGTTSVTNYKIQVMSGRDIRTVRVNRTGDNSGAAVSSIIAIEVAQ